MGDIMDGGFWYTVDGNGRKHLKWDRVISVATLVVAVATLIATFTHL